MAQTVADARGNVSQFLDDPNNIRWSTTQIDAGLATALSACVSAYVSAGGSAFNEEASFTTSSTGLASLSTVAPLLDIRGVQGSFGSGTNTTFTAIPAALRADRYMLAQSVYTLSIVYVRDFALSTTTTHPLVGNGATAAASWPEFDMWICMKAALLLGIKDNDQRPMLANLEAQARQNVLNRINTPKAYPLSLPRNAPQLWAMLSYVYTTSPTAPTLQLVRARGQGFGGWGQ
jgi:hypothetical protein